MSVKAATGLKPAQLPNESVTVCVRNITMYRVHEGRVGREPPSLAGHTKNMRD